MASMNRVTLIGNLGQDPAVKVMPNGDKLTVFTLATSESWKDKQSGEKKEKTVWHNLVAYRGHAELIAKYLVKGSPVFVEGKLDNKKYNDKNGNEQNVTQIVVTDLKFFGSPPGARSQQNTQTQKTSSFDDMEDTIPW